MAGRSGRAGAPHGRPNGTAAGRRTSRRSRRRRRSTRSGGSGRSSRSARTSCYEIATDGLDTSRERACAARRADCPGRTRRRRRRGGLTLLRWYRRRSRYNARGDGLRRRSRPRDQAAARSIPRDYGRLARGRRAARARSATPTRPRPRSPRSARARASAGASRSRSRAAGTSPSSAACAAPSSSIRWSRPTRPAARTSRSPRRPRPTSRPRSPRAERAMPLAQARALIEKLGAWLTARQPAQGRRRRRCCRRCRSRARVRWSA